MTDWENTVAEYLTLRGWRWVHYRPAETLRGWRTALSGSPGLSDFICCRERVVFLEAKTDKDRIRPDQQEWISDLLRAGAEVHVFRPVDREEMERIMR